MIGMGNQRKIGELCCESMLYPNFNQLGSPY